ncbi:MAG: YgfZ/GcvT domain-containing protein [Opitutales bacterium]
MSLRCASVDTAVVRVTGEDAAAFLQGQCTADLRNVALTDALWLNRKGRVLAHTVVAKEADGTFLLLCPHLSAADLIAVVTANVIADDVVATDESSVWRRYVAWGAEPNFPGARLFATKRFGVAAWDILVSAGGASLSETASSAELEALRVAAGVPAVPADCGANEFPQECGLEAWVSYAKGCYLGQEVMARIQSMGSLRRILRRVTGPVTVGQELKTPEGKVVGTVRSAAGEAGLALVSVDLTEGSLLGSVRIGAPAQMPAR